MLVHTFASDEDSWNDFQRFTATLGVKGDYGALAHASAVSSHELYLG